ncbi:uncharacterized protein LOC110870534 [Helianthus annuus]|uniref:uncharacterized protein LOC110870534 n=1 Tax=Helianthus annuus TaxID=4232 RepID=UPI000B9030CD|nr:uncharacterized protein LOC110870534 [Helianthus annuus]
MSKWYWGGLHQPPSLLGNALFGGQKLVAVTTVEPGLGMAMGRAWSRWDVVTCGVGGRWVVVNGGGWGLLASKWPSSSSSSSSKSRCLQCHDSTTTCFRNGWRLRNGERANLCYRCACIYENGRFCETFHSDDDGWRDCQSCRKLVHCGCVVSFNQYFLLDLGGVICRDCSKKNLILARNRRHAHEFQTDPTNLLDLSKKVQIEPHYRPGGIGSVTFYRAEPGGKMAVGYRKDSVVNLPHQFAELQSQVERLHAKLDTMQQQRDAKLDTMRQQRDAELDTMRQQRETLQKEITMFVTQFDNLPGNPRNAS